MTIQEFAAKYQLRITSERRAIKEATKLDGQPHCDVEHIPGRRGWIRADRIGFRVAVMGYSYIPTLINKMKELGFRGDGRGDQEVMRFFDPADEDQAKFAIRSIQARHKRQMSEVQRLASAERLQRYRKARKSGEPH